ncbi:MAG: HNH endonuclease [Aliishimia sp.]
MARLPTLKPRLGSAASRLQPNRNAARDNGRRSGGPYNTARWQRLRLKILNRDLWMCQETGVLLVGGKKKLNSAVVDHIKPHRGDMDLFWDERNLRSVCKKWHDQVKQSLEKRGLV